VACRILGRRRRIKRRKKRKRGRRKRVLGLEGLGGLCEEGARIGYLGGDKIATSCIILLDPIYRCKKVS